MIFPPDNKFLTHLITPGARACPEPNTELLLPPAQGSISDLLEEVAINGERLVVPKPTLADAMSATPRSSAVLDCMDDFSAPNLEPLFKR